jgi:FkbM family methyltransferase
MRTQQLQIDLSGVAEVFDITGVDLDIDLPDGVEIRRCEPAEIAGVGAATAPMVLMGPNSPTHSGRMDLDGLLRRLPAGGRAILLLGWTAEDLPGHWLLDVLAERGCQIGQVGHSEFRSISGIETTLVVTHVGESSAGLALANLSAVAEFGISGLKRRVAELSGQLNRVRKSLTTAEKEVNRIHSSAGFQAGQALTEAVRSPIRGVVTVPRDLSRIWRGRSSRSIRRMVATDGSIAVPIALPSSGAAADRPPLITLTAPATLIVPRNVAAHGLVGYEPSSLACFLAATDVAGPGAVYDIGANIGIYAALASAMTDRAVCAFEPWPVLVEVARQFSDDNKLGFTTEAIALGAGNGTADLYLSDRSDSSNSLNASFRTSSHRIQVPVETLDSYVDRTGLVPAVIKVDTETTEPDVLAGAMETITKHRPWILGEVLAERVESDLEQVLAPVGYRWYQITEETPFREAARIAGDTSYNDMMWLFAPEKPGEAFWAAMRERQEALSACTAERGRQLQAES